MCIAFWSLSHPSLAFVFAANRDEYLARGSEPARWRTMRSSNGKEEEVLCGVDLQEGGTWLGISRDGNFAALTNFREAKEGDAKRESRGHLVRDVLIEGIEAIEGRNLDVYRGFSMLCGRLGKEPRLQVVTNRPDSRCPAGPYKLSKEETLGSLSNDHYGPVQPESARLWPKVRIGATAFANAIGQISPQPSLDNSGDGLQLRESLFKVIGTPAAAFDASDANTIRETVNVPPIDLLPPTADELYGTRSPEASHSLWYATRSQVVLLVDREGRATFVSREAHALDDTGKPFWSGKETGSWSFDLPS